MWCGKKLKLCPDKPTFNYRNSQQVVLTLHSAHALYSYVYVDEYMHRATMNDNNTTSNIKTAAHSTCQ